MLDLGPLSLSSIDVINSLNGAVSSLFRSLTYMANVVSAYKEARTTKKPE